MDARRLRPANRSQQFLPDAIPDEHGPPDLGKLPSVHLELRPAHVADVLAAKRFEPLESLVRNRSRVIANRPGAGRTPSDRVRLVAAAARRSRSASRVSSSIRLFATNRLVKSFMSILS